VAELDRGAVYEKRRDVDDLMNTDPKHYMRTEVWLPVARRRAEQCGGHISYFALTTSDLYDVRLLEQEGLLEKTERGYPGLGICEFEDVQFQKIVRNVRWCGWSYKGRFEDMALHHPQFEESFSFDVINLDFTAVPFPNEEAPLEGTWGAIERIVQVQMNHRRSFDLFLTFRSDREQTDFRALQRLSDLLDSNLQAGRGLREFEQRTGTTKPSDILDQDYTEFLCLGVPKLLIAHALDVGFDLSKIRICKYARKAGAYFIVKFVFSFEVPSQRQRSFAEPPTLVSGYDAAVPLIFNTPAEDVMAILEADTELSQRVHASLAALNRD
jgi:hypothetical protein